MLVVSEYHIDEIRQNKTIILLISLRSSASGDVSGQKRVFV